MRWQGGAVGVAIALLIAFASLLLMGFGLGELIRLTLSGGDLRLERHLAANPGVLRTPMQGVTYLGSSVIVLTVMAVAAAVCVWNSSRREALMLVVVVAGAFLLYTTIKDLVDRPRPPVPHLANAGGASFPSAIRPRPQPFMARWRTLWPAIDRGRMRCSAGSAQPF